MTFGKILRAFLGAALLSSMIFSALSLWRLGGNPIANALVERSQSGISAAVDRALARIDPSEIEERLEVLIAAEERDWMRIDLMLEFAEERALTLTPDLGARIDAARAEDGRLLRAAGRCAACAYDRAQCDLSATLMCGLAVDLTPIGDVQGVLRQGRAAARGESVDRLDLGLSVVGLGATGLVLFSGGTSLSVKAGAGLMRTARGMGRLAPRVADALAYNAARAFDWRALATARPAMLSSDIGRAARPAHLRPLLATVRDFGSIREAVGVRRALHLAGAVDTTTDVSRLARVSRALGPRTARAAEALGSSRLLRMTLRVGDEVAALMLAAISAIASLLGLFGSSATGLVIRRLRRFAASAP